MAYLGWLLVGLMVGAGLTYFVVQKKKFAGVASVAALLSAHFRPTTPDNITISKRGFPCRMRADLQRGIEELLNGEIQTMHFCGVRKEFSPEGVSLSDCIIESAHYPTISTPPEYEEIDIGDDEAIRVLKAGLWLLESDSVRFAVLLAPAGHYSQTEETLIQVGVPNTQEGTQISQKFFRHLEAAILEAKSYRGKVLSLEKSGNPYSGEATGVTVHKLRAVTREQVILPDSTLQLLERNVIQFVQQREKLAQFKQATKKGLLFYGPPGTGKTHTIHYLSRALEGHTTLLISAEQVALLDEYMTLARLLQPSIVVIEDVDLIARERTEMGSPCEEVLLNKLLNEMDGLKQEADILFLLTTNRPESLEAALASRPGRVDQAIEFPLPNDSGRQKLVRLYSEGVRLSDEVVAEVVLRTEGVSASFIKELMRRSVQFHIERDGTGEITREDTANALDEMLVSGGSLNLKLLGAAEVVGPE